MAPSTPVRADAKAAGNDKDAEFMIAVFQCLESEPKVDLEKLRELTGMKTKASANTKWHRMRVKYMPQAMSPNKRKADDGIEDDAADSDVKPKTKTPRKPKSPKKMESKKEDDEEDQKLKVKSEAPVAKHEEDDEGAVFDE